MIIIDVITEEIGEGTPRAMLFADDLVLCDPDREMIERMTVWTRMGLIKGSKAKTEHIQTTWGTAPVRTKR